MWAINPYINLDTYEDSHSGAYMKRRSGLNDSSRSLILRGAAFIGPTTIS